MIIGNYRVVCKCILEFSYITAVLLPCGQEQVPCASGVKVSPMGCFNSNFSSKPALSDCPLDSLCQFNHSLSILRHARILHTFLFIVQQGLLWMPSLSSSCSLHITHIIYRIAPSMSSLLSICHITLFYPF